MDTLKVCVSLIIACLNKCLKSSLHKRTYTAAENCLLTKEICLCLCSEGCLKDTCSCTTDSECISECKVKSLTCCILMYGNKTRNTLTCLILTSYCMARSLRSYHCYINALRWNNLSEMDVETMSEHKHVARLKIRLD